MVFLGHFMPKTHTKGVKPTIFEKHPKWSSFYWPHHYTFTSTSAFGPSNSVSSAILFTSATWTPQSSPGGGVAPEMNASFIPQVALMLACLFFLLGRKKENTEQMMTA